MTLTKTAGMLFTAYLQVDAAAESLQTAVELCAELRAIKQKTTLGALTCFAGAGHEGRATDVGQWQCNDVSQ